MEVQGLVDSAEESLLLSSKVGQPATSSKLGGRHQRRLVGLLAAAAGLVLAVALVAVVSGAGAGTHSGSTRSVRGGVVTGSMVALSLDPTTTTITTTTRTTTTTTTTTVDPVPTPVPTEPTSEPRPVPTAAPTIDVYITWKKWATTLQIGSERLDGGFGSFSGDGGVRSFRAFAEEQPGTQQFHVGDVSFYAYTEEQPDTVKHTISAAGAKRLVGPVGLGWVHFGGIDRSSHGWTLISTFWAKPNNEKQ